MLYNNYYSKGLNTPELMNQNMQQVLNGQLQLINI